MYARDYFNPLLLEGNQGISASVDLEQFSDAREQAPGTYIVDIVVNGNHVAGKQSVPFTGLPDGSLSPCLTPEQLIAFGVNPLVLKTAADAATPAQACLHPEQRLNGATATFDFAHQKLQLSVPQAMMINHARGYIPPDKWDEGISAILLNYQYSGAQSWARDAASDDTQQSYLSLQGGINLGAWRLRSDGSYMKDDNGPGHWDTTDTWLERDVAALQGELTLGDKYTDGSIFDSVPVKGVMLESDTDMLPDTQKGFAPTIHGIAKSNAQVTIRQHGNVIYQTYVSPGAFAINDLYPTSGSGDLQVTVKESDGSENRYIVPYASVPSLQREGYTKYSIATGQYHGNGDSPSPWVTQLTLMRGMSHGMTLYGGGQVTDHYDSGAVGLGENLGELGAVSLDVTFARSEMPDNSTSTGQSFRVQYAKSLASTGTIVQIMGDRYSSSGYYSLEDNVTLDPDERNDEYNLDHHQKNKFQLSLNQPLSGVGLSGSFYASISTENYWGESGSQRSVSLGFSDSLYGVQYSINYSYSASPDDKDGSSASDQTIAMNLSIPFSVFSNSAWATYNISAARHGDAIQQAGISGTALKDNNLNYSVQESYTNHGAGDNGNASLNYTGSKGDLSVAYGYDDSQDRLNYGASGGVLISRYGLVLSQYMNNAVALVNAGGAAGVAVQNETNVRTNSAGYTIMPFVSPYRANEISLDSRTLPANVDLESSRVNVIPTRDAVVMAKFTTHVGYKVLFTLLHGDKPLPFGAVATQSNDSNDNSGIVGDGGQLYMSGLPPEGLLLVQWGNVPDQQCQVSYQIKDDPSARSDAGIIEQHKECL